MQFGGQVKEPHAVLLQELDRVLELLVAADLDAEGHAGGDVGPAQLAAQILREEPQRVVLGAVAQECDAPALVLDFLRDREAHVLGVHLNRRAYVLDEEVDGPDLRDLERPCNHHAADLVLLGQHLLAAVAGLDVDALGEGLVDLVLFRHLREARLLSEAAVVHVAGLAAAVPALLLDAVVELVHVAVGVVAVDMPVAAGHVTADAHDGDLALVEVVVGANDLGECAGLPRNLVDVDAVGAGHALRRVALCGGAARGHGIHHLRVEQHEGVVVCAVAHEVALAVVNVLEPLLHLRARVLLEIVLVRDLEAEKVPVKDHALFHVVYVEAKVAQPPDLEGLLQHDTADVVELATGIRCHRSPPVGCLSHNDVRSSHMSIEDISAQYTTRPYATPSSFEA